MLMVLVMLMLHNMSRQIVEKKHERWTTSGKGRWNDEDEDGDEGGQMTKVMLTK